MFTAINPMAERRLSSRHVKGGLRPSPSAISTLDLTVG